MGAGPKVRSLLNILEILGYNRIHSFHVHSVDDVSKADMQLLIPTLRNNCTNLKHLDVKLLRRNDMEAFMRLFLAKNTTLESLIVGADLPPDTQVYDLIASSRITSLGIRSDMNPGLIPLLNTGKIKSLLVEGRVTAPLSSCLPISPSKLTSVETLTLVNMNIDTPCVPRRLTTLNLKNCIVSQVQDLSKLQRFQFKSYESRTISDALVTSLASCEVIESITIEVLSYGPGAINFERMTSLVELIIKGYRSAAQMETVGGLMHKPNNTLEMLNILDSQFKTHQLDTTLLPALANVNSKLKEFTLNGVQLDMSTVNLVRNIMQHRDAPDQGGDILRFLGVNYLMLN